MTKLSILLFDKRGVSAMTLAIIGGLICVIWVEISRITGISASDVIEVARYNLGLKGS